ncbi:glycosyl transferase family 2 [Clostridium thermosuccinogenes]|jgi:cellulose synthase/poly-beta-1,6-N-acetylglucosamine synthase-like glycosyltransferase|uniref:Glycosyl transferase family 2 n=1 Tax=Clostridium thermosuccinogenes TaxID=84032 RepID=A0A2K2F9F1_9CLOT|nr:glycosyltransferase family 2 protein [Pseudoclostridium thermosuccinogenes]AUS95575.1 glycosyl transferase family 2 [Pseudoclostridium thermosuccinogenes]PNT90435.1 glycosyl transferase family 2 [Pseudoclostridium thermosuccinogenes]PNT94794.1 glycosyl transferase family 2 [Pseudoclostridium thermosuccinogenes]PNT95422.1 glycosyl transferase family 2 [Pseudoclostridium thermosuccinogenes]
MLLQIKNILLYTTQIIQIIIFIAGCYFLGISIFGWVKKKEEDASNYPPQKRFAILIAAHNEERVIAHIINSLSRQNYPKDMYDIYVIADNCTDRTAEIAEENGAIVYVRNNDVERGKGFALEWMFKHIFAMGDKYDVISVFDADNLVSSNYLLEMNKQLCKGHKVVQGYLDSKNPFDSWITCSYSIAFWLSNRIFQLPRYYLGLSCGLCGTGFCIDIEVLKKIGWGATCLTEDLEFTMKLALNGMKVAWAQNAVVYDEKPLTLKQSWNQRKRWMQGHADCAARFLKPLFKKAFTDSDLRAFDCAVYLFQPIRYIFIGLITVMMWIQTVFPESPFYSLKYVFPAEVWTLLVLFQTFYGPLVILAEKKMNLKVLLGFLIYPFYCLTWVPITIQGFISKDNKVWSHTVHTREISINELEKA